MSGLMHKGLMRLTRYLKCRVIPSDSGNPYLERYHVCTAFGYTVFLHRFVVPQDDRHYHTHPWRLAFALILCGGYIEQRLRKPLVEGEDYTPWVFATLFLPMRVNIIRRSDAHRIASGAENTWTLFVCSHDTAPWGFWDTDDEGKARFRTAVAQGRRPDWWVSKAALGKDTVRAAP